MAVFAPVNQAAPDQRRKQLVAKLMQQAQAHGLQSAANAGLVGTGPVFHSSALAQARPMATQASNLAQAIAARMGEMGHGPAAAEHSQAPGQAVPAALPVQAIHASAHFIPVSPVPAPQAPAPSPAASDLASAFSNAPSSLVPLGAFHMFDPVSQQIVSVPPDMTRGPNY